MAAAYSLQFSSFSNLPNHPKLPNKPSRISLSTHFTKPLPRFGAKHDGRHVSNPRISAVAYHSNSFGKNSEENWNLDDIYQSVIIHEDSIISALLERSIYCRNINTYERSIYCCTHHGSLDEYMVLHDKMGRYYNPDEYPFFPYDLNGLIKQREYPKEILEMYVDNLLPNLWKKEKEDDGYYGSTAVCDTNCLQSMWKRINYGKFVAEAKYKAFPEIYEPAIKAQDKKKLWNMLTNESVEERVRVKAKNFGQNLKNSESKLKIDPELIAELYGKCIIPLINEVEVKYLLKRLD